MLRIVLKAKSLGFAAALVLALGACGGSNDPSRANVLVGGASGTEPAAVQVLHLGNGTEIATLDPHRNQDVSGSNVLRDLFEGLVAEKANGDIGPGAAESWTVSDDGKTYVFNLRRGALWSNGDPVTAGDFVYGLQRSADPATLSTYTFILSPIVNADDVSAGRKPPAELGVRAIDDFTLEIKLANATPYFIGLLAHSSTYPLNRASVEKGGEQFTRPGNLVGNGAFKLVEWVVQSHAKLVRNPNYWDNASTKLDEVWYYPTEDQSAELQRYRANELDYTYVIPNAQVSWIRANLADQLILSSYLGSYYYGFNMTRPPFKDNPKLRRALALAVNRNVITEQILGAGQKPAFGWLPPVANYTPQQMVEAAWTQAERETEAKRLYAEAGYSETNPLRTEIMYNTEENHRRIAIAITAMWKQVLGVEATISNSEWKVFIDTRNQKKDTQVFREGWIGDYNDAFTFAELLRSTAGQNTTGFNNPEYDRLIAAAQQDLDLADRRAKLEQAESLMLADLPILPLYYYVSQHLVKPWVGGWSPNILDHHPAKYLYVLKH